MPCIIIIEGVLPSDLVSVEQFFMERLTEELEDPIEELMRQAVLVRDRQVDMTCLNNITTSVSSSAGSSVGSSVSSSYKYLSDTSSEINVLGMNATGMNAAGMNAAGINAAGMNAAGINQTPIKPIDKLPQELVYRRLPVGGCHVIALPPPTSFRCWNCDLTFDTPPWFIPTDMREERNNVVVLVASGISGNFCSDVCACGWLPQFPEGARDRYTMLLRNEIQVRTGRLEFRMPEPIPKTDRREYGGAMSIEEYRQEIRQRTLSLG